jgi:hypothetical protein
VHSVPRSRSVRTFLSGVAASGRVVMRVTCSGTRLNDDEQNSWPAHVTRMTTSRAPRLVLAASAVLLAFGLTGCDGLTDVSPTTTETSPVVEGAPGTALEALETVEIKGRAPKTGYSREEFGSAWSDVNRSGCDTRNEMLNRDLEEIVYTNSVPCKVQAGVLDDPYTGATIGFERGQETSALVQIDHVIALSDAWQKGAQQLSAEQRLAFANDPLNLLSVDGPANMAKGDGDAATWLPSNRSFRCEYVALQTAVKVKYTLWMTAAERDAIAGVFSSCPDQPLPVEGGSSYITGDAIPDEASAPGLTPTIEEPIEEAADEPVYANCTEVRAAGAAPIHPGDPGFQPKFDRSGNGIGCQ